MMTSRIPLGARKEKRMITKCETKNSLLHLHTVPAQPLRVTTKPRVVPSRLDGIPEPASVTIAARQKNPVL